MGKLKGPMMIKPCHTFTAALDDSADFTSVVRNFLHKHCTNAEFSVTLELMQAQVANQRPVCANFWSSNAQLCYLLKAQQPSANCAYRRRY